MQCGGICSLAEGGDDCWVPSLQTRYWYCGAFSKCESQRGRVLSDFFNRACAHGAFCDLDSTDSHALCLLRGNRIGDGMDLTRQKIFGNCIKSDVRVSFILYLDKDK